MPSQFAHAYWESGESPTHGNVSSMPSEAMSSAMPQSAARSRRVSLIRCSSPLTIADPQWVMITRRTPSCLHQASCSMMVVWPMSRLVCFSQQRAVYCSPIANIDMNTSEGPRTAMNPDDIRHVEDYSRSSLDPIYPTAGALVEWTTEKGSKRTPAIFSTLRIARVRRFDCPTGKSFSFVQAF